MTAVDLDDDLSDLDPPSESAVPLAWSDDYVRAIWTLVYRRDDVIVDLRRQLAEANEAVRELQAMNRRAHT